MSEDKYTKKNIIDILCILQIIHRTEADSDYKKTEADYIKKYKTIIEDIDSDHEFAYDDIAELVEFKNEVVTRKNKNLFFIKTDFSDTVSKADFMEGRMKSMGESHEIANKNFEDAKQKAISSFIGKTITRKDDGNTLKFEITEFIANGSFGLVFKCYYYKNGRKSSDRYAIKVIFSQNQDMLVTLAEETRIQSMIHSEFVMKILVSFNCTMTGIPYPLFIVVNKLMDGDLDFLLQRYSNVDKTDIMKKIAKGLFDVHRCGIIHRDLKPANILFRIEKDVPIQIKISDFGSAIEEKDTIISDYNHTTLLYTSPEQLKLRKISFTHDVWSLGCIYYHLFTSKFLFLSNKEGVEVTEKSILDHQTKLSDDIVKKKHNLVMDKKLDYILNGIFVKIPIERLCLNTIIDNL